MTIIIILGFVLSFFVLLYLVWYRSNHENNEKLFDTSIISFVSAIIFSRIAFMIAHIEDYIVNGWSIFPFYLQDNQRVWLENLPWSFFKLDDGILFVSLPLFVLIASAIYLYISKTKIFQKSLVLIYSSFVVVFLILSLLSIFNLLSNELSLDYMELMKIGLILGIFIIVIVVFIYYSKITEVKLNEISIQAFLLAIFISLSYFLILYDNKSYDNSYIFSGVYVFISLIIYLIHLGQKSKNSEKIVRVKRDEGEINKNQNEEVPRRTGASSYRVSYSTIISKKPKADKLVDALTLKYYKLIRKSGKRETNKD
jgi:hypothetical protein